MPGNRVEPGAYSLLKVPDTSEPSKRGKKALFVRANLYLNPCWRGKVTAEKQGES